MIILRECSERASKPTFVQQKEETVSQDNKDNNEEQKVLIRVEVISGYLRARYSWYSQYSVSDALPVYEDGGNERAKCDRSDREIVTG